MLSSGNPKKGLYSILIGIAIIVLSIPSLIKTGLTQATLENVSREVGLGTLASILVLWLSQALESKRPAVSNVNELISAVAEVPGLASANLIATLSEEHEFAVALREVGLEYVYETREAAYADIAEAMRTANNISIVSGSLHSFWSLYREVLLARDRVPGCEVKVVLLKPDSVHLASRSTMDVRMNDQVGLLAGYTASIQQIHSELKNCKYMDMCCPASIWIVDNKAFVTPYFYDIRGGQGFCVVFTAESGNIFGSLRQSVIRLIEDLKAEPKNEEAKAGQAQGAAPTPFLAASI